MIRNLLLFNVFRQLKQVQQLREDYMQRELNQIESEPDLCNLYNIILVRSYSGNWPHL